MIGKLTGIIDKIADDHCIIDVNGVGYLVYASKNTLSSISIGNRYSLVIETYVREDKLDLIGFLTDIEKMWFLELNKVSGVGIKMAIAIIGNYLPKQIKEAILTEQQFVFSSISGVGPKLASRIITELKNRALKLPVEDINDSYANNIKIVNANISGNNEEDLADVSKADNLTKSKNTKKDKIRKPVENNNIADAVSALENLGYNKLDAYSVVGKIISDNENITISEIIKEGLKRLSSSKVS